MTTNFQPFSIVFNSLLKCDIGEVVTLRLAHNLTHRACDFKTEVAIIISRTSPPRHQSVCEVNHNDQPNPYLGAKLTYYIFEGVLVGQAGKRHFHISAHSGGGGGSKVNKPDFGGVFHPYSTGNKTVGEGAAHKHGGAIPPGRYIIHKPAQHPQLKLSAYLEPDKSNDMMNRDRFYIHGRGTHGSDGCIVPSSNFKELMDALAKDGTGILHVEEAMGGSRFA